MKQLRDFWKRFIKITARQDVFFSASAITFNLFICAIPFILIIISILGYVLSYEQAVDFMIRFGDEWFPSFQFDYENDEVFKGPSTIESLISPLLGARNVFGIVGIVVLIFFTQGLLHSLKHIIFEVFEIEERKHPVLDVVYNFLAFGIVGSLILFFSLFVSVFSLANFTEIALPFTEKVIRLHWLREFLDIVVPILATMLLQYVIFRYVSERKIRPKVALMGAITYTILFEIARYALGFYLQYAFATYKFFYQGYAVLIVVGIWVFYSAFLFVLTVILARAYKDIYISGTQPVLINPYTFIS